MAKKKMEKIWYEKSISIHQLFLVIIFNFFIQLEGLPFIVNAMVLSGQFWPQFKDQDSLRLPMEVISDNFNLKIYLFDSRPSPVSNKENMSDQS